MIKFYGAGTEITNPLKNGLNTSVVFTLPIGDSYLEVKSKKPLSKLYIDGVSTHDGSLSMQYYDGSTLSSITDVNDSTLALKAPGFVSWTNESNNAKDGDFYRYVFNIESVTVPDSLTIRFVGMIFAEDFDLKNEYPSINEYLVSPDTNFNRFHVASKDDIVAYFRGKGNYVYETEARDLTEFDFIDPEQVRQAAKYLALSKIFFYVSDAVDDKYYEQYKDLRAKGYDALDVYYLTLDKDGDGEADSSEMLDPQVLVIQRG